MPSGLLSKQLGRGKFCCRRRVPCLRQLALDGSRWSVQQQRSGHLGVRQLSRLTYYSWGRPEAAPGELIVMERYNCFAIRLNPALIS